MFLGLILGRKPWFDPFRPHLPPPNIYIVGKLWIWAFIWRWAIKIWSILQAVRILLPSWNRIMHSYLHSVLPEHKLVTQSHAAVAWDCCKMKKWTEFKAIWNSPAPHPCILLQAILKWIKFISRTKLVWAMRRVANDRLASGIGNSR